MSEENQGESTVPTFTQESAPSNNDEEALDELEAEFETGGMEAEAEMEAEQGRIKQIFSSLSNTEPHPPLSEVEFTPDTENGGLPRIMRGLNKASPSDGEMLKSAWFDIGLGTIELLYQEGSNPMGDEKSDSDSEDGDGEYDTISVSK